MLLSNPWPASLVLLRPSPRCSKLTHHLRLVSFFAQSYKTLKIHYDSKHPKETLADESTFAA